MKSNFFQRYLQSESIKYSESYLYLSLFKYNFDDKCFDFDGEMYFLEMTCNLWLFSINQIFFSDTNAQCF